MSYNYDEYRKKIENFFVSDLDKAENKLMKKILFIMTKQSDLSQTIKNASIFCDKTHTHIKFINAAHYYSSQLKDTGIQFITLQEMIDALESCEIENSEVSIIKEGKEPFESIKEIVNSSQISLIIVQYPFSDTILSEQGSESNLGKTLESLITYSLIDNDSPPLLLLKNTSLIEEGYNHVIMAGTDWINDYAFNTLIQLSNTLQARVTLLPFIKESIYKESEVANKILEVTKEVEKFIKEANEWLTKHKYAIAIEKAKVTKNRFEFLGQLQDLKPDLVALYVPRKTEVIDSFLEVIRKTSSSIIIVPELH